MPLNNDDDDYDDSNTPDKDQTGAIVEESDLLPILLHKVKPVDTGGKYTLEIPDNIKVWKNDDRTSSVTNKTEFDASQDTILYVEGVTEGSKLIKINWKKDADKLDDCDRVKITVFKWLGPLNVPGFAIYPYTATGALETSKWATPVNGTIKTGAGTSNVTILWGAGPSVGKAVYEVNENYLWDLEVNVIQVKIKTPEESDIKYKNPPKQTAVGSALITAADPPHAMEAKIMIARIAGPTRATKQHCGVKFVEVGFIQNSKWRFKRGLYNDSSPKKMRVSSLEKEGWHVDPAPGSTPPWSDSANSLFAPPEDKEYKNQPIILSDTPTLKGTDPFTLGTDQVDELLIYSPFRQYLAVRTKDKTKDADKIYTQRAYAVWAFDGDGEIDAAGVYKSTGSGNYGSNKLREITDGSPVPVTTGTSCNDMLKTETWSTENQ